MDSFDYNAFCTAVNALMLDCETHLRVEFTYQSAEKYGDPVFDIYAVNSWEPGRGHATEALRRLIAIAAQHGVTLRIFAASTKRYPGGIRRNDIRDPGYFTERAAQIYERAGFTRLSTRPAWWTATDDVPWLEYVPPPTQTISLAA